MDLIPLTPDELRLRGQMFDTLTVYVSRKYLNIGHTRGATLILLKNSLTKEKENFETSNAFTWRKIARETTRNRQLVSH